MRGEIAQLSDHRSGHLYLDLVDPDDARGGTRGRGGVPTLKVKCWRTTWTPLRHALAKEGIELAQGMVVVLRGSIDVWRVKGEVSLVLVEIDVTALLGRLAADRTRLLRTLEAEGLLTRNASLAVPAVPVRVGLVASPGTEGCRDFLGQLLGSGFGFQVSHVKVPVQGPGAPASIARALTMLGRSDCDVIAVVRGGGAKADLAAFETEAVARAVATCPKPVFTGIGHSGDETVADVVAGHVHITPTACGQHIVALAQRWWSAHVTAPADRLAGRVPSFLTGGRDARCGGPEQAHRSGPPPVACPSRAAVDPGLGARARGTGPVGFLRARRAHAGGASGSTGHRTRRSRGGAPRVMATPRGRLRRRTSARTGLLAHPHSGRVAGAQHQGSGGLPTDRDTLGRRDGPQHGRRRGTDGRGAGPHRRRSQQARR